MTSDDGARQMLRHTVATLAYRGGKALRGAPESFAAFSACPGARTPAQILAHVGDLFDWACALADGKHFWHNSQPLPWDDEVARFFAGLERFDRRLADGEPLGHPPEKLFQGPVADALTHVGQIAMLRRMAGAPIRGENYFKADIQAGRAGAEQAPSRVEFD
ncbi:MAG TPA: hypothetical protein VJT67_17270 [Longimicrobiaceae bacterium]|nr:hypothetical protein [Longimicrobiaceae bacterium]